MLSHVSRLVSSSGTWPISFRYMRTGSSASDSESKVPSSSSKPSSKSSSSSSSSSNPASSSGELPVLPDARGVPSSSSSSRSASSSNSSVLSFTFCFLGGCISDAFRFFAISLRNQLGVSWEQKRRKKRCSQY